MAKKKIFSKLPREFQTKPQQDFYQATIEQLFASKNVEKMDGFIGRRVPGYHDPISDYYIAEPNKNRTYRQLEPMAISVDPETQEPSNEMFYDDFVNKLNNHKSLTGNEDRLFSGEYYSFAPPIDIDKFLNYPSYVWCNSLPAIDLPTVDDYVINTSVLGEEQYTYINGDVSIPFSSGLNVTFSNAVFYSDDETFVRSFTTITETLDAENITSITVGDDILTNDNNTTGTLKLKLDNGDYKLVKYTSYKDNVFTIEKTDFSSDVATAGNEIYPCRLKKYAVEGVGSSIRLVDVTHDLPVDTQPDYMTIARGAIDNNEWSRTNRWYHRDILQTIYDNIDGVDNVTNTHARRPIIEFTDTIELFGSNRTYYGDADVATNTTFAELNGSNASGLMVSIGNMENDGHYFLSGNDNERVVFLNSTEVVTFLGTYGFVVSNNRPYDYVLSMPITEEDTISVSVLRPSNSTTYTNPEWYTIDYANSTLSFRADTMLTDGLVVGDEITVIINGGANIDVSVGEYIWKTSIDINNKIYLHPTKRLDSPASEGDGIVVSGNIFYGSGNTPVSRDVNRLVFDGVSWDLQGQQKTQTNQAPKFNLYYSQFGEHGKVQQIGDLYGDFSGSEIFSFKRSETSTTNDSIIGYPLEYKSIGNYADIVFEHDLITERYFYDVDGVFITEANVEIPGYYYFKQSVLVDGEIISDYNTTWKPFVGTSTQRIVDRYVIGQQHILEKNNATFQINIDYPAGTISSVDITNRGSGYIPGTAIQISHPVGTGAEITITEVGIFGEIRSIEIEDGGTGYDSNDIDVSVQHIDNIVLLTLSVVPDLLEDDVYDIRGQKDSDVLSQGTEFIIVTQNGEPTNNIIMLESTDIGQVIEFRTKSRQELFSYSRGYYEIPTQLECNPLNAEISTITANELTNHFISIISNQVGFTGEPFGLSNNYRDTKKDITLGSSILQTEDSLLKAMFIVSDAKIDIFDAIRFSKKEYTNYKDKIIKQARALRDSGYSTEGLPNEVDIDGWVAETITRIANTTPYFSAFSNSHMFGFGEIYTQDLFEYDGDTSGNYIPTSAVGGDYVISISVPMDVELFSNAFNIYRSSEDRVSTTANIIGIDYDILPVYPIQYNGYQIVFTSVGATKYRIPYDISVFSVKQVVTINDVVTSQTLLSYTKSDYVDGVTTITLVDSPQETDLSANTVVTIVIGLDTQTSDIYDSGEHLFEYKRFTDIKLHNIVADENIYVRTYVDMQPSYMPSTPSKVGCYPVYMPMIYIDDTYTDPVLMLQAHDGSKMPTYTTTPNPATFQATVNGGVIITITPNYGGSGYVRGDTVTVVGSGTGATAMVQDTDINGRILSVTITNGGSGYTSISSITATHSADAFIDIVDLVVLEIETRIYNTIVEKFRNDYDLLFGIYDVRPGAYRNTRYTRQEFEQVSRSIFLRWKSEVNANYTTNDFYDENDWKTWNYRPSNPTLPGHWKGIYRYFYDTVRPHICPWEMLGFSQKPSWWDDEYTTDYSSSNVAMWTDIKNGNILYGNRQGIDERFIRTGMKIPVDVNGDLKSPHEIGLCVDPSDYDNIDAPWTYGDGAPVEEAWYNSSDYAFGMLEILYLMRPSQFGEKLWDPYTTINADIQPEQFVSSSLLMRNKTSDDYVHGETDLDGNIVVRHGYQRFISDRLSFINADISSVFGKRIRSLDAKLGHKLAGFTNSDTLKIYLESTGVTSDNISLLVPEENRNIKLYHGAGIREYVYSGVAIRLTDDGEFEIRGYDSITPEFYYYGRSSTGTKQQISVGGKTEPYLIFNNGTTYKRGQIVRHNTVYYQAKIEHTAVKFEIDKWKKLNELPQKGAAVVSYTKQNDGRVYTLPYGTTLPNIQDVFDFLIGYGEYLESQGWVFDIFDSEVSQIKNWLYSAKTFLFWTTTTNSPNSTIFLSAGAEKIQLIVGEGYPDQVERITNGVYSIMDEHGYAIPPIDTIVSRDGRYISVSHINENVGIYCFRVTTREWEHILIFDNFTEFGDTVYNSVINSRQNRLQLSGYRTKSWTGKLEAPGYLIVEDKIYQNIENIVDSMRFYHDPTVPLDNQQIEDAAKHLIGFENRKYMDDLRISGDTQFQFYKGMIKQKGTKGSFDKILRSEYIQDNENIRVNEEWAFKMGEFGSIDNESMLEFIIDDVLLKTDPQIIELKYPPSISETGTVSSVMVVNAEKIYSSAPDITISSPQNKTNGVVAKAEAILGSDKRISEIKITNPGYGYVSEPTVTIAGGGKDVAWAFITRQIDADVDTDQIITIDIDDKSTWITRPTSNRYDYLLPTTSKLSTILPNAGHVHFDDIDFTSFSPEHMFGLFSVELESSEKPKAGNYIWVANLSEFGKTWDVFNLKESESWEEENELTTTYVIDGVEYTGGFLVVNEELFSYETGTTTSFYDVNKNNVTEEVNAYIAEGKMVMVFISCRSEVEAIAGLTTWVDDYQSSGKWAVISPNGEIKHQQETYINSKLMINTLIYDERTKNIVQTVPVYDPLKDLIPGPADANIRYKSDRDPAKYTHASDQQLIDNTSSGGEISVGDVWWDLNDCRYVQYEMGSLTYRRDKWGTLFPGSQISIYEWVESREKPDSYIGDGQPKNSTDYIELVKYDVDSNSYLPAYYFWVKNKKTIPSVANQRTLSTTSISRMILNPRSQGYSWFSFISDSAFIFNNINSVLSSNEAVIQINYKMADNRLSKNTTWKLIQEGIDKNDIPEVLLNNMIHSLSGTDSPILLSTDGSTYAMDKRQRIPNPRLSTHEKYGNKTQPKQTWFVNLQEARRTLVQNINANTKSIAIRDINPSWAKDVPSSKFWKYTDWWETGYENVKVDKQTKIDIDDMSWAGLSVDNIVRYYIENDSWYYRIDSIDPKRYTVVGREKNSIELLPSIYTTVNSLSLDNELYHLLRAILKNVFIGDFEYAVNDLFFSMINYVSSEQKQVDWFFKTTYVKVTEENTALKQYPLFRPDTASSLLSYFHEAKPYTTKIRSYSSSIQSPIDEVNVNAWDMDSLSYTTNADRYDINHVDYFNYEADDGYTIGTDAAILENIDASHVFPYSTLDYGYTNELSASPYLPIDVPRFYSVTKLHDSIQCAFQDRAIHVNLGKETIVADGTSTEYVFENSVNVEKLHVGGFLVPKNAYTAVKDEETGHITVQFLFGVPPESSNITVFSGVSFIHTAIEEMRLAKMSSQNGGAIDVLLDIGFDVDGKILSGWGASPWAKLSWGADGITTTESLPQNTTFTLTLGAAHRYLKTKSYISDVNDAGNPSEPRYSQYCEFNKPTNNKELEALELFKADYASEYKCSFEGDLLDGEDFDYSLSIAWDVHAWDVDAWDEEVTDLPVYTPTLEDNEFIFLSLGDTVYNIPYDITVTAVNEVTEYTNTNNDPVSVAAAYTITPFDGTKTVITLTSTPDASDPNIYKLVTINIEFDHENSDVFDNGEHLDTFDGSFFAQETHDMEMPDELAQYNVTESIVFTVDTNSKCIISEFEGDGIEDSFTLPHGIQYGVSKMSVYVNAALQTLYTDYDIVINPVTGNRQVVFAVIPAISDIIEITYTLGAATQIYCADDASAWSAQVRDPIYIGGDEMAVDFIESGWDVHPWDADGTYVSHYLIPSSVPLSYPTSVRAYTITNGVDSVSAITQNEETVDFTLYTVDNYVAQMLLLYPTSSAPVIKAALKSQYASYLDKYFNGSYDDADFDTFSVALYGVMHTRVPTSDELFMYEMDVERSSFRVHMEELGETTYSRLSDDFSTTLYADYTFGDTDIKVTDASVLPVPSLVDAGIIWIKNERIEYHGVVNEMGYDRLIGILRGTNGTSPIVIDGTHTYVAGTAVFSGEDYVPNGNQSPWENSNGGLSFSTTVQADYLNAERGTATMNDDGCVFLQPEPLPPPPTPNVPPVADAGTDDEITLPANSATLNGTASTDSDGVIVSYAWSKISGPNTFTIVNPVAPATTITNMVEGTYVIMLTVTDDDGASDTDTKTINVVVTPPPPNTPPVADAGPDQTITLPTSSVNVDGSGSYDPP